MKNKFFAALGAAFLGAFCLATSASAFTNLQPGVRQADLDEQVRVNVVLVGIEPGQASSAAIRAQLPNGYRPLVRSRLFYGIEERLGLDYTFDYSFTYASDAWEDRFFDRLADLGEPANRTLFQDIYNDQDGTRDVGANHFIDAPSVEKWLIDNAPAGIDTRRNTIFFVNWWGRDDFIDHVYTKFGEPDPDTGNDFGVVRESRKIIAWGGTTPDDEETGLGRRRGENRVWFFDLSAGPEAWGGNYDITFEDLDGDEVPDYRIPVAWEYAADGYRSPALLASDLGKVARYAAINLLFTTSPLYPPYLTPELLPSRINLDLNTYEGWDGVNASRQYQDPRYLENELSELFPSVNMSVDTQDLAFTGQAKDCYVLWLQDVACDPSRPRYPPFANLFLYNAVHLDEVLDQSTRRAATSRRYEAPAFNYATGLDLSAPFLGFADDNYTDGTQSFIFNFVAPDIVELGYGLTTTQIHEYGHHFGMSHPHDGFDSETGIDYGPTGPFFFAWASDEQNSMMSYIDLNWDFSQWDRDNAARHQAAGFIMNANMIAQRILASPRASRAADELRDADREIGRAKQAIAAHDYEDTWEHAREAYEEVLDGARDARVNVEASFNGWAVDPPAGSSPGGRNSIIQYGSFDKLEGRRALP